MSMELESDMKILNEMVEAIDFTVQMVGGNRGRRGEGF